MPMITSAQLIDMIIKRFKDQYGNSLTSKILWILRRVLFFMRSWFFDLFYYSISIDDLMEALKDWKNEVLDIIEYLPEVFDCDDFAVYFKSWLQSWARAKKCKAFNGVGIAIGMLFKDYQPVGGHAWNIVLVHSGSRVYIVYVEPQLGEIIPESNISSDGYEYYLQAVII